MNSFSKFINERLIAPQVKALFKAQHQPPAFGVSLAAEVSLKDAIGQPFEFDYSLLYSLYKLNADVSGSVHKWAGAVTSPGWRITLMDDQAKPSEAQEGLIDETTRWLKHPNPNRTSSLISYELALHLAIGGDAFLYVSRDSKGRPLELWPMHPAITKIVANLQGEVLGYVMRAPGSEPVIFTADEVLHFPLPNPTNSVYGEGRVELLMEEAGVDLMALRSNKAIFQNGLSPSAVLLMDENASSKDAETMTGMLNQKVPGSR